MTPHSPSSLNPIDLVTNAIGAATTTTQGPQIVADPTLKLGVDLNIREREVILSEGDSMQGSHYCAHSGTYILQWRLSEQQPSLSQHHTSFDFSLTGPKCKVMYYYELLDSANFK